MIIQDVLKTAQQRFELVSDSPRLDAECLLSFVLQKPSVYLRTWPEKELVAEVVQDFKSLVQRREQGEPIAYILELKQFWSLDLKVSTATLIPRPETELLVEQVIRIAKQQALDNILELGTGTGAIAIAIGTELSKVQPEIPTPKIIATDISSQALDIAKHNSKAYQQSINLLQSNWFEDIPPQQFDLIVSNPPYIECDDVHLTQGDVRFEPISALASGRDGLTAIRHIAQQGQTWLKHSGWLLFEHGYQQAKAVRTLLRDNGFTDVQTFKDLAKNERVTLGKKQ